MKRAEMIPETLFYSSLNQLQWLLSREYFIEIKKWDFTKLNNEIELYKIIIHSKLEERRQISRKTAIAVLTNYLGAETSTESSHGCERIANREVN
jgi:hypothetical protein